MRDDLLRRIPGLDQWLASEQGAALCAEFSRPEVVRIMREHLQELREGLREGTIRELPRFDSAQYCARLCAELMERRRGSLRRVINATGIIIHTNLGRAPLAPEAIEAIEQVARGYSSLEFDLGMGKRGSREAHVESLLTELTGAESALVVNNCAGAVVLMLNTFAKAKEVVISRGELIEIGGSFRMPEVIAQSGARMVEVGTTNKTRLADYARAIGENTMALLSSHPSNYRVVGFSATPPLDALADLAREHGLLCMRDLGSGSLVDLSPLEEPTVSQTVAQGVDLVAFSGDKLLGGPQAGIIVGRAELTATMKRNPLARALRIDKLSLAALSATLRLYMPPNDPRARIPVLRMITEPAVVVDERARQLLARLTRLPAAEAVIVDDVSYAGGGASPMLEIPTRVIRLSTKEIGVAELARRLRAGAPPVIGRIARGALCLDLRTVDSSEIPDLGAVVDDAIRATNP
jgi:L-seryl-tRNA(Ser) seleniumtransferase